MVIAFACTKNWYYYQMVLLYSLLESTKNVKRIYLLVETEDKKEINYLNELIEKYKVEVILINFKNEIDNLLKENCENRNTIYSNFCFGKLSLPRLLKDEDKVLYIDTDTIVKRDISKVWRINIDQYYVAGCKDYGVLNDNTYERMDIKGKYINSGFMLMNLKKLREDNIQEKWFEIINEKSLKYPDQDALNVVCQYKTLLIHSMYNFSHRVTKDVINLDLVRVYHYAGPKIQWLADKFYGEEWYEIEEKFLDEFGIK